MSAPTRRLLVSHVASVKAAKNKLVGANTRNY